VIIRSLRALLFPNVCLYKSVVGHIFSVSVGCPDYMLTGAYKVESNNTI
jgi:hypothetical protein